MKKVILLLINILYLILFTGSTTVSKLNETIMIKNEETSFSNALNDVENFSIVDALESYIKVASPSVQVYYYTKKYCKEFDVPETIAFSIVKLETSYYGPDKYTYNPSQISYANAYGTYQLLLSTARDMYELLNLGDRYELTPERLLTDVDLNTKLGIRYLKYLYDNISKDWKVICGFYNTGYPIVNSYAINATKYI